MKIHHDFDVMVKFQVFADSPEQAKERVQWYIDFLRLNGVFITDIEPFNQEK